MSEMPIVKSILEVIFKQVGDPEKLVKGMSDVGRMTRKLRMDTLGLGKQEKKIAKQRATLGRDTARQWRWVARDIMRIGYLLASVGRNIERMFERMAKQSIYLEDMVDKMGSSFDVAFEAMGEAIAPAYEGLSEIAERIGDIFAQSPELSRFVANALLFGKTIMGIVSPIINLFGFMLLLRYSLIEVSKSIAETKRRKLELRKEIEQTIAAYNQELFALRENTAEIMQRHRMERTFIDDNLKLSYALKQSSVEHRKLANRQIEIGKALDSVNKGTKKQIGFFAKHGRKLKYMALGFASLALFGTLFGEVAETLEPIITPIIEILSMMLEALTPFFEYLGDILEQHPEIVFVLLAGILTYFTNQLLGFVGVGKNVVDTADDVSRAFDNLNTSSKRVKGTWGDLFSSMFSVIGLFIILTAISPELAIVIGIIALAVIGLGLAFGFLNISMGLIGVIIGIIVGIIIAVISWLDAWGVAFKILGDIGAKILGGIILFVGMIIDAITFLLSLFGLMEATRFHELGLFMITEGMEGYEKWAAGESWYGQQFTGVAPAGGGRPPPRKAGRGKRQLGGFIEQTGLYTLHAGEFVLTPRETKEGGRPVEVNNVFNITMGRDVPSTKIDELARTVSRKQAYELKRVRI